MTCCHWVLCTKRYLLIWCLDIMCPVYNVKKPFNRPLFTLKDGSSEVYLERQQCFFSSFSQNVTIDERKWMCTDRSNVNLIYQRERLLVIFCFYLWVDAATRRSLSGTTSTILASLSGLWVVFHTETGGRRPNAELCTCFCLCWHMGRFPGSGHTSCCSWAGVNSWAPSKYKITQVCENSSIVKGLEMLGCVNK